MTKLKYDCFTFTKGTNIYDFFLIPTIRIANHWDIKWITLDWLKFYIGVTILYKESD